MHVSTYKGHHSPLCSTTQHYFTKLMKSTQVFHQLSRIISRNHIYHHRSWLYFQSLLPYQKISPSILHLSQFRSNSLYDYTHYHVPQHQTYHHPNHLYYDICMVSVIELLHRPHHCRQTFFTKLKWMLSGFMGFHK